MPDRAPEFIDPVVLAGRGECCRGELPVSSMERLCASLVDSRSAVGYELEFTKEGALLIVDGKVVGELVLECQVCLREMILCVDARMKLGIVKTLEEASRLPESCEPLIVTDRKIPLRDIVEEELLLSLPIIPRHEACEAEAASWGGEVETENPAKKPNPFAVLADLNKTGDN